MLSFLKRYARTFLATTGILLLCLLPSEDLDKIDLLRLDFQDLAVHLIMFGGFSLFLFLDLKKALHGNSLMSIVLLTACISLAFGVVTELLQYWMVSLNRTASLTDWLFDAAGTAAGISIARLRARSRGRAT